MEAGIPQRDCLLSNWPEAGAVEHAGDGTPAHVVADRGEPGLNHGLDEPPTPAA